MRLRIAVVLVMILCAQLVQAQTVTATAGLYTSVNIGERPGADIGVHLGAGRVESVTFFNSSSKRDGGFKVGQSVVVSLAGFLVGADYRYRDGGTFTKETVWAVVGHRFDIAGDDLRFVWRVPIWETAQNDPHGLHAEYRAAIGDRVGVFTQVGVLIYRDHEGAQRRRGAWGLTGVSVRLRGRSGVRP